MSKVIVCGALGYMGQQIIELLNREIELDFIGGVERKEIVSADSTIENKPLVSDLSSIIDNCDIIVDFTNPLATIEHIKISANALKPIVIGTTGMNDEQMQIIKGYSEQIPVLVSPNMSIGINLLFRLLKEAANVLSDFDVEIMEIHHHRKKDAPSGTAKQLYRILKEIYTDANATYGREGLVGARTKSEIGIHSLRGGDIIGEHTIIFAGEGERLELTHKAHSRRTFAVGTIKALRFLLEADKGYYDISFNASGDIETDQTLDTAIIMAIGEEARAGTREIPASVYLD